MSSLFCFISSFMLINVSLLSPNFCSLKVLYCCRICKTYAITENVPTIIKEFYTRIFMIYKLSGYNLLFIFRIIWANRILTNDTHTHTHTHTHVRVCSACIAISVEFPIMWCDKSYTFNFVCCNAYSVYCASDSHHRNLLHEVSCFATYRLTQPTAYHPSTAQCAAQNYV